ncbi:hypothetical protein HME9304_02564 [Flagellimonas maritima]|uniref:Uncharacterized protein n=1 Tax=Flagellimonas maritima TaxID=1383885 RepID=A0A2Z4LUX7_9FLAO|nr:hypothetical protein HME9304_02564 [Allomuricauda aurantiaca]
MKQIDRKRHINTLRVFTKSDKVYMLEGSKATHAERFRWISITNFK